MPIKISDTQLIFPASNVELKQVEINGEPFSQIVNADAMPPFLMTLTSVSNHWMFITSKGALTAGRVNPNHALLPYTTDDKLHDSTVNTGPVTVVRVKGEAEERLWLPLSDAYKGIYRVSRSLYKNTSGNKVIFEEVNHCLSLTFRYTWMSSHAYGWVRKCQLINTGKQAVSLSILDGLRNILPASVDRNMQANMSTLVDAYKRTEIVHEANLAIFRLSSIPVDRAEPSEALKVNSVWHYGLPNPLHLLSTKHIETFMRGGEISPERETKGQRGCLITSSDLAIKPQQEQVWYHVAEVDQDITSIQQLIAQLKNPAQTVKTLEDDIKQGDNKLNMLVERVDGIQTTPDPINDKRHFANVLFNTMRGGIFVNDYSITTKHFLAHLQCASIRVYEQHKANVEQLGSEVALNELMDFAYASNDPNLIRLTLEFLPLTFSRRHGDPSRPWNLFNIELTDTNGNPLVRYQGNWRDIFQNWEALAVSYPNFLPNIIARFLNASTADGYNPYRLTSEGFDWEVLDPSDPWSNIGYWGDHQIIYLLKLLELHEKFFPEKLSQWFNQRLFSYANVPYRLKPYQQILANPYSTITFDNKLHSELMEGTKTLGSDAKLVRAKDGSVLLVSLAEKLLLTLLVKLSNFIPDAGIWLNAQRPEWNDANNALVGRGASMVTVYHIRRYIVFLQRIISQAKQPFILSAEVATLLEDIQTILTANSSTLIGGMPNNQRKKMMDALGKAGQKHRDKAYAGYSGGEDKISADAVSSFLTVALQYINHTIDSNRRPDGLFHSYNLIHAKPDGVDILRLPLMLEGQVAALSSGIGTEEQAVELLQSLFDSDLWRPDQRSFMLYPNLPPAQFLSTNHIPADMVRESELLSKLSNDGNRSIVTTSNKGTYHFQSHLRNADALKESLSKLPSAYTELAQKETNKVCAIYESVFNHRFFTGRSGSFFKYEGLGSIYWHMVSKLLLGVGDLTVYYGKESADPTYIEKLRELYSRIREGIGAHKTPPEYGAFPTDPYSHTPQMMGAQQPGMTGQVKEDILSRLNELGIEILNGSICINPVLLTAADFLREDGSKGSMSFTFAGTPFRYTLASESSIVVEFNTKGPERYDELVIPAAVSAQIFQRTGTITRVKVSFGKETLQKE